MVDPAAQSSSAAPAAVDPTIVAECAIIRQMLLSNNKAIRTGTNKGTTTIRDIAQRIYKVTLHPKGFAYLFDVLKGAIEEDLYVHFTEPILSGRFEVAPSATAKGGVVMPITPTIAENTNTPHPLPSAANARRRAFPFIAAFNKTLPSIVKAIKFSVQYLDNTYGVRGRNYKLCDYTYQVMEKGFRDIRGGLYQTLFASIDDIRSGKEGDLHEVRSVVQFIVDLSRAVRVRSSSGAADEENGRSNPRLVVGSNFDTKSSTNTQANNDNTAAMRDVDVLDEFLHHNLISAQRFYTRAGADKRSRIDQEGGISSYAHWAAQQVQAEWELLQKLLSVRLADDDDDETRKVDGQKQKQTGFHGGGVKKGGGVSKTTADGSDPSLLSPSTAHTSSTLGNVTLRIPSVTKMTREERSMWLPMTHILYETLVSPIVVDDVFLQKELRMVRGGGSGGDHETTSASSSEFISAIHHIVASSSASYASDGSGGSAIASSSAGPLANLLALLLTVTPMADFDRKHYFGDETHNKHGVDANKQKTKNGNQSTSGIAGVDNSSPASPTTTTTPPHMVGLKRMADAFAAFVEKTALAILLFKGSSVEGDTSAPTTVAATVSAAPTGPSDAEQQLQQQQQLAKNYHLFCDWFSYVLHNVWATQLQRNPFILRGIQMGLKKALKHISTASSSSASGGGASSAASSMDVPRLHSDAIDQFLRGGGGINNNVGSTAASITPTSGASSATAAAPSSRLGGAGSGDGSNTHHQDQQIFTFIQIFDAILQKDEFIPHYQSRLAARLLKTSSLSPTSAGAVTSNTPASSAGGTSTSTFQHDLEVRIIREIRTLMGHADTHALTSMIADVDVSRTLTNTFAETVWTPFTANYTAPTNANATNASSSAAATTRSVAAEATTEAAPFNKKRPIKINITLATSQYWPTLERSPALLALASTTSSVCPSSRCSTTANVGAVKTGAYASSDPLDGASSPAASATLHHHPTFSCIFTTFETFYKNRHTNRRIAWAFSLCTATVQTVFVSQQQQMLLQAPAAPPKDVCGTFIQATVLLYVDDIVASGLVMKSAESAAKDANDGGTTGSKRIGVTPKMIAQTTGLPIDMVRDTLASLSFDPRASVLANFHPDTGAPIPQKVVKDDFPAFALNHQFRSPSKRVDLPKPRSAKMAASIAATQAAERAQAQKQIIELRRLNTQIAIIRFMKSRGTAKYNEMAAAVLSDLRIRFDAQPSLVKETLEQLIVSEYVRRDDADYGLLVYIA